jgi:DUF4097 and DUF4098 domain-containing protein YvlB
MKKRTLGLVIFLCIATAVYAGGDRARHKETRTLTLAADSGTIAVDGRANGGISVTGWDRAEIEVVAKIQTWAATESEAVEIASKIEIDTSGTIVADGPARKRNANWSVSYELKVPFESDLDLEANNGGISIADVFGNLNFRTTNGGISLEGVGGSVDGRTTNGGVHIDFAGSAWDGDGLRLRTTNGGIVMNMPADYSAELETGTVNGRIDVAFPVTVHGKIGKSLKTVLGNGGGLIDVRTTNGSVSIK